MELISHRDNGIAAGAEKPNYTGYEFFIVANHDEYYKTVKKTFRETVEKLYGDQTLAIEKIKRSEDRKCLILAENRSPVAILVYKIQPTSEFSEFDIKNSLEVKTFMLINSESKDRERHFVKLHSKVVEVARQMHVSAIHVTVAESVTWTMSFLLKVGFKNCHNWKDKYVQGLNEYMFCTKVGEGSVQRSLCPSDRDSREGETKGHRDYEPEPRSSSEFRKHEQDSGSRQGHCRDNTSERLRSERYNESSRKREYEGECEYDSKRQRSDVSSSQYGSHEKRNEYGGRSYGLGSYTSDRTFPSAKTYGEYKRQGGGERDTERKSSSDKKVHQCTQMKRYIHMIQQGKKTVEGRINSGMFRSYKKDDHVRFYYQQDVNDDVTCQIEEVNEYKSFKEMLEAEGVASCIPGIYTVPEGVRAYHQIPGYEERARQHGVLAFKLKVLRCGSSAAGRR